MFGHRHDACTTLLLVRFQAVSRDAPAHYHSHLSLLHAKDICWSQANCVVDIVVPQQQQEAVAVLAEVRWAGGVPCPPHLIDSTWARVRAHADEAGDSKGATPLSTVIPCGYNGPTTQEFTAQ